MNSREPLVRPGIDVHQYYTLDIPSSKSAGQADIYSFKGTRGIGEPTKYHIEFTHPTRDLQRSDYINRMASFVIQPPLATRWGQPEEPRRIYGVVTSFAQIASNHDETMYSVTLESRLALLRNMPRTRYFFDKNEPEVVEQILKENGFNKIFADFLFKLYRTYRKREIITQYCEDDLAFITRLCRRVGIWFVCETGERCEVVRFGDDFTHYVHDKEHFTVPYREPNGLHTAGRESVQSLAMQSTMVPTKFSTRSYSTEQPNNERVNGTQQIYDDSTTYGETYTWGLDLEDEQDAKREVELRREAALAGQIVYSGTCDMLDIWPSCVLELSNRELPEVKYGLLMVSMTCSASRKQGYKVEFTAIPSDRQYRMPLLEKTWPRIQGVITGTIASTKDYVGPYMDDQGRYIVNFHADRDQRTPGLESCPMRLAKPFGGQGQTGFHFGLEPGTIVTVGFLWGNPDRPYISQVLHTARHTDPIHSGHPWAQRHTLHTRANNTLQMEDRKGQEHIKLATESGKSQLNLGYLVNRKNEKRGDGIELRTDNQAAVRGGGGVLLTADNQAHAQGHQTDTKPASDQFSLTQAQAQELAQAALTAKAEVADLKTENDWLKSELAGLKEAVIALSAPHGIGMATPGRMMVSTAKDTSFATSASFNVSAFRKIVMAAKEAISVFAQTSISLIAARGKVQIQAITDGLDVASQKDAYIRSIGGKVIIEAKDELLFKCGGSYISIKPHNLTNATPGDYVERAASWQKVDPDGVMKKSAVPYVTDIADLARHGSRFSG
ncbi:type VI secretion system Vgr family protein [Paraburkholderia silvatlantica]|uniref:type VI secretion system Vgr family protein n=1 Tax=Paraburkholderia silvatlantica TaxID=321895 RepID=UPI00105F162D|nr:type VI secretion system Vgr family protein [Paraburkholderia silvatlantica]TDQ80767.1 type VI secretion system secreted protein VgrG [Paraburkholderia silvatlantica]